MRPRRLAPRAQVTEGISSERDHRLLRRRPEDRFLSLYADSSIERHADVGFLKSVRRLRLLLSSPHDYASTRPALAARNSAAPGGAGGMSVIMNLINSVSSSIRKALLWRFSNPSVEIGLALKLRPQIEPA